MKRAIIPLFLAVALVATTVGCATTAVKPDSPATTEKVAKVLAVATKVNDITGNLMKTVGPLVITGICAANPVYCAAAKDAYPMALAAQKEYAQILADAKAANMAPDGTKLATLAATFQTHFATINNLVVQAGGNDNSPALADLGTNLAELQAVAASQ